MLRGIAGVVLVGAVLAATFAAPAVADMLPYDPATGKAIDGAAVLLGLAEFPAYTFVIFAGGCFDDEGDEGGRERGTIGTEDADCGYKVVEPGVAYRGVPYESPNASSDEFFALPARRFPVKDGKVPALERVRLGTLLEWQSGAPDSPLVALGQPPGFVELHRFSERVGLTDYLRVTAPCRAPRLQLVRREWQLEGGEVLTQTPPPSTPSCEVAAAAVATAEVAAPVVVAEAPPVVAPVVAPVVVAPALPAVGPAVVVAPVAAEVVDTLVEPQLGSRELVLGGVWLLAGLGSGVALRRRRRRVHSA